MNSYGHHQPSPVCEAKSSYETLLTPGLSTLFDRASFIEAVGHCIGKRHAGRQDDYSVILLDCDSFKIVNDSLGHRMGDRLLVELSRRLKAVIGGSGHIAYLGGDEFAILLDKIGSLRHAIVVAERVIQDLRAPITIGDQQLFISVSLGITTSDIDYLDPIETLRDAESALYYAKASGRGQYAFFTKEMRAQAQRRLKIGTELRFAEERGEFQVYYQPIVGLKDGELIGCEALLRWFHPRHGMIAPGEFLPIASEQGLITQLDRWVITNACRQLRLWRSTLPGLTSFSLSVNMSAQLLGDTDLVRFIQQTLNDAQLPPGVLTLEVTEETVITQGDSALLALNKLRELGVKISLDDFGTRYSSLSYLHELPITTLKLDRSFIRGIESNQRSVHVVRAVNTLAHALELSVVGEGVESEAHVALLRSLGCDFGQGFFFARPMSAADATALFEHRSGVVFPAELPPALPAVNSDPAPQRDALTGLLARSLFAETLEGMIGSYAGSDGHFALIVLDLDFFKSVNDAFGHARGDQILSELAARISATVRKNDLVFRYGGDELTLLLPDCDRARARVLAIRLVEHVAATPFEGDPPLVLSSSMGVAIYPDDARSAAELFEVADRRNYQAKRSGRGRAVWDDLSLPEHTSVDGPSRLIERDLALQVCHQFLDEWPSHGRGALRITAAPRAGASRFLAEVEQAARLRGQTVLHLRGTVALRERAYGIFLELRESWPELPLPSAGPLAFAAALRDQVLKNGEGPLLIIVDSLATADQASLDLIQAMFALPDLRRLAVVYATPRSSHSLELPRQHVLHAELDLDSLSVVGLRTWLRHSLNWEAPQELLIWLHAQTQGRPGWIRDGLAYLLHQGILNQDGGHWQHWADFASFPLGLKLEQLAAQASQRLPLSPGLFIGHESELPRLKKQIRQHRLVQLSGPGGIGKSRLAIQTAAEMRDTFADGIFYVRLDTLGSGEYLAYAVAEALNLSLTGTKTPTEQLCAHLANRQLLLILDDLHMGNLDLSLLSEIEFRAPQVHILLTTRDRLSLPGLEVFPVPSLSYPEQGESVQLERHSAVQLFVLMARKHVPDYLLSDDQRVAVARICRLVGGLPLGIELAAAWVRVLSPEAIAQQIEENLGALEAGGAVQPPPERTMLAMVDSLWNLLSEDERRLLRFMSCFRGSFSTEAAREVVGASLFFLEALVSKGYLRWSRQQRFESQELLRQYAAARLRGKPDELQTIQEWHSHFYLRLLRQPELLQLGSQQQVSAVNADQENIRSAWAWVVAHHQFATILQHIEGLETFYDLKGSFHEAEAVFAETVRQLHMASPPVGGVTLYWSTIGRLYAARARFLLRLSLYSEARETAEQAMELGDVYGDLLLRALSLYHIGTAIWRLGDYQSARDYFEQANTLANSGALHALEADCLRRLSRVTCDMARYDEARAYGERSLAICRDTGERQREARVLNDLGIIADSQGDYQSSRGYYEQCLQIYRLISDLPGEAQALHNLGAGAAEQGFYAESEVYLERALRIFREIGLLQDEAIVIENLGDSARLQGDIAKAQTCYQQALHICREIGDRQGQAFLLGNLGLIAHQSGANHSAILNCEEALAIAREINDRRAEANALLFLGHALAALEHPNDAASAYRTSADILYGLEQPRLSSEPMAGLAQLALSTGQLAQAMEQIAPILSLLDGTMLDGIAEPMRVFLTCYQVLAANADARAEALLRQAITLLHRRAALIVGEERRRQFLYTLPSHQALLEVAGGAGLVVP